VFARRTTDTVDRVQLFKPLITASKVNKIACHNYFFRLTLLSNLTHEAINTLEQNKIYVY